MNRKRRGIALVINNIEFKNNEHTKRVGAEFDSINLEEVLSRLHFDVRVLHDKTQCEMRKHLEKLAREDHSDADCFMCVIMSHGQEIGKGELGVLGVDGKMIDVVAEAKSIFSNKNCPTLKDKPKLFFVDACWGSDQLQVYSVQTNSASIYKNSSNSTNSIVNYPDISDFLFSFSTLPTYVSLRDHKGNWFIQEFVSALNELGETRTLSDIMHTVRQKLIFKTKAQNAQMSMDHWVLSRHLIFTSKEKRILCSSKSNTYLLGVVDKGKRRGILLFSKFEYLPLLTQIGQSCKFASLDSDLKSIHIWLLLGKGIENLHVLSGHSHEVTVLQSFEAKHNNTKMNVLASGSEDGSIRIWSVKSGECLQNILGHEKRVVSFEWMGANKLASSSLDDTIRVWDISFHFVLNESIIDDYDVFSLQIPGMFILAYGILIQVYDSTTGGFIHNIKTDILIRDLKFIGGNRILIAKGCDIQVINVVTGSCEKLLQKGFYHYFSLVDNEIYAVGSNDDYFTDFDFIDFFDLNLASCRQRIRIDDKVDVPIITLSLGNNQLVTGFKDGTIMILNVDNGKFDHLTRGDDNLGDLEELLLLDNGNMVSFYKTTACIWNVRTRTCVSTIKDERFSGLIRFPKDSRIGCSKLVVALGGTRWAAAIKNNIYIGNTNGFERELIGHTDQITALKWLGNSMLASGSADKQIRIWQTDAPVGECLTVFTEHKTRIEALMLFGKNTLASAAYGEKVRVWNFNIRQQSKIFNDIQQPENDEKNAQLFTSIGTDKLAIVYQNKISVWDVTSSILMSDLSFNQEEVGSDTRNDNTISCLQSHGDHTLIGVVDSTIFIWNVLTGQCMHILKEHREPITSLLVASGREEILTGSLDGTIRVWDLSTGNCKSEDKYTAKSILSLNSLNNDASFLAIFGKFDTSGIIETRGIGQKGEPFFIFMRDVHILNSFFQ